MNMELNLNDLIAKLRALDRRLQIALAAGLLLLLYYVFIGTQLMGEIQRNAEFVLEEQTLMRTITVASRLPASPQSELEAAEVAMAETLASLSVGHMDEVYVLVDNVASRSRVNLATITSAAGGTQSRGGITYQTRRVSVRVDGSLANIRRFIEEMSKTTLVSVTSINFNNVNQSPTSANIEMTLFLQPQVAR